MEHRIKQELQRWESVEARNREIRAASVAPWAHDQIMQSPIARRYAEPTDLRRIATEMRTTARALTVEAQEIDRQRARAMSRRKPNAPGASPAAEASTYAERT
jgi:hypothetical protein